MLFDLVRPCSNFPFRTDCLEGWLGEERATEIFKALTEQQLTFSCHKTTTECEDTVNCHETENSQHCAGAMILLEKLEQPNQMMRWMERINKYDRLKLKMDSDVFDTGKAFIEHHT